MTDEQFFGLQVDNYFSTRRNKRYGRDQMEYEVNIVPNLVRGMRERQQRTLRILRNYAFISFASRPREIFATECEGRRVDHEACDIIIPLCDRLLSRHTFNNRKGMGSQAAINQVIEDILVASNGYTEEAWIIKLDMSGFFPNALWSVAQRMLDDVINKYRDEIASMMGDKEYPDYLHWLVLISVNANPAAHYERRTAKWMWDEYIKPEKSITNKPEGVGAAIGRLVWQTAMGLYINDEVKWLNEDCGINAECFVDDILIVVPDRLKSYTLTLIPELRSRLAKKSVKLNEKKFYCQQYWKGVEFLGSHIKPFRNILNDSTWYRCLERIDEYNQLSEEDKFRYLDQFMATVNSYTGLLKNRTSYKRICQLKEFIDLDWWKWLDWCQERLCVVCKPEYTEKKRLQRKYHIKTKQKRRKCHEKRGNSTIEECGTKQDPRSRSLFTVN